MNLSLDLGAHACRSLRGSHNGLAGRRSRSMAAWLSDGERQRAWLERNQVPCFPCDDHLALIGDHAEELVELFPVPYQDLLLDGKVPFDDAVTRQLIALFVEALLPPATTDGDVCCFSQPAHRPTMERSDPDLDRRLEFASRMIRLRGYEPCPFNPAVALVLAEMEPEKFTGIGISLGASGCDLALTHRGNPAAILRTSRGGRWIDEELANRTGRICHDLFGQRVFDVEAARRRKEGVSLLSPVDDEQRFVVQLYRQLTDDLAYGIEQLVAENPLLVRFAQPLTVVLGGGSIRIPGFEELFRTEVERRLPSDLIGSIRCELGDFTVARGCLIQATLVAQSRRVA